MTHDAVRSAVLTLLLAAVASTASAQQVTATVQLRYAHDPLTQAISLPFGNPGIADVANSRWAGVDKCVDGVPRSPTTGDGIIDSTDLLCLVWGGGVVGRHSTVTLSRWDADTCRSQVVGASWCPCFNWAMFGGAPFSLVPGATYLLTLQPKNATCAPDGTPPPSAITLTDTCPSAFLGTMVRGNCTSTPTLLYLPYLTAYRDWDEVLCGQRGLDWDDTNRDGVPDQCPNGIFDGWHAITVERFDQDPASPTYLKWVSRTVTYNALLRRCLFSGQNRTLMPGEAVMVLASASQIPTFWNPPTVCP